MLRVSGFRLGGTRLLDFFVAFSHDRCRRQPLILRQAPRPQRNSAAVPVLASRICVHIVVTSLVFVSMLSIRVWQVVLASRIAAGIRG